MNNPLLDLDYQPQLPAKTDYGIAVIGCGSIVTACTLPCYRRHGLNIVGCYDINPEAVAKLAKTFEIPKVYRSLNELLNDPQVDIVEIAVMPQSQLEIVKQVLAARKHLLCQKPLSNVFAEAIEIVRRAEQSGLKLAVNQQMRWAPSVRAARNIVAKNLLGRPYDASIHASFYSGVPNTIWADFPRYELLFHSIHYTDSIRFIFGEPELITCRMGKWPLQGKVLGETKTVTVLDYANGLQVTITVEMCNPLGTSFFNYQYVGTEGIIDGTFGINRYPHAEPDTLFLRSKRFHPEVRLEAKLEGSYFPDAFIGPIASLMEAITIDGIPETSGADNLVTLAIIEAAYRSAAENRSVKLAEISREMQSREAAGS